MNLFFLLVFFLFPSFLYAGNVGVIPLNLNLTSRQGTTEEFKITVYSDDLSDSVTPVTLSIIETIQDLTGKFQFKKAVTGSGSCTSWIEIPKSLVIPIGGRVIVNGKINTPNTASGTCIFGIMVERTPESITKGANLKIRFVVRVVVDITGGRTVREKASLDDLSIVANNKMPWVAVVVENTSKKSFSGQVKAEIRTANRKVVDRMQLFPLSNIDDAKQDIRIFPGRKVRFAGKVTKPLHVGEYKLKAFLKYGRRRQLVAKKDIVINEGDFVLDEMILESKGLKYQVNPLSLDMEVKPGRFSTSLISVSNLGEESSEFQVYIKETETETDYTCYSWVELNNKSFTLKPGRTKRVKVKVRAPKEAKAGHYCRVMIRARLAEKKGADIAPPVSVEVRVVINEGLNPQAKITNIDYEKSLRFKKEDNNKYIVSIFNKGNIHLIPTGVVYIFDRYKALIEKITLEMDKEVILPAREGELTGEASKRLVPGRYLAKAEIDYGGVKKAIFDITFEEVEVVKK